MASPSAPEVRSALTHYDWRKNAARVRWRLGWMAVALTAGIGLMVQWKAGNAQELAYLSKALMFAGVALLLAHPFIVGALNLAVALSLFPFALDDVRGASRPRQVLSQLSLSLNRSAGHMEALLAWMALALNAAPWLWLQATLVAAIFFLGPILVDGLTARAARRRAGALPRAILYVVTLVGVAGLVVGADPDQASTAAILFLPLLAGMIPRLLWWELRSKPSEGRRSRAGRAWAERLEKALVALAVAAAVLAPLLAFGPGAEASTTDLVQRTQGWTRCEAAGDRADLALFIVSDNQYHAMDGTPSGFHLPAVDAVVPVSVRPVELDLLSEATLLEFARRYHAERAENPALKWAHLGDIGDLACQSELARFDAVVDAFGRDGLASLAVGNHDVVFVGNLAWHPDWSRACPKGRADAAFAHDWYRRHLEGQGRSVSAGEPFFASVAPLGEVDGRPVLGVFFDTNQESWDAVGVAGAQGGFTRGQRRWLEAQLGQHPEAAVLLFGHHPLESLSPLSQRELDRFAEGLGERLWGLVTAHTHLAALRDVTLGGRKIPQLVVGSTTDAPQEAAVLELGTRSGERFLRLRTLPAVARAGTTCSDPLEERALSGERCRTLLTALQTRPGCEPLFAPPTAENTCGFDPLTEEAQTPDELRCAQEGRALRLLRCIAPERTWSQQPLLDATLFPTLRAALAGERREELICLSWAASILQAHKGEHWGLPQALAFANDRSATFGTIEIEVDAQGQPLGTPALSTARDAPP